MRKMIVAVGLLASMAGTASAQWGSPPMPGPGGPPPESSGVNRFGWNPSLKKCLFWWKKDTGCTSGNCGGAAPAAAQTPGTLVFPQHPFVRSPRDFFMWGN